MDVVTHVNELLDTGQTFCLVTVIASRIKTVPPGQKAVITTDGTIAGTFGSNHLDQNVCLQAQKYMNQKKSGITGFEEKVELFFNVIASETRLLICGAGHIAIPLAQFSVQAGLLPRYVSRWSFQKTTTT